MLQGCPEEVRWIYWQRDAKVWNTRQEVERKSKEEIYGCKRGIVVRIKCSA